MTSSQRKFINGLIIGVLVGILLVVPLVSHAQADPIKLKLNVPIPGFFDACADGGVVNVNENTFGCYVRNFYVWFTGVAGILAVVMIMWAGMQWVTSAGNDSRITSAKNTMNGAAIGFIILLGSYLILTWINPALISLRIPALTSVDPKLLSRYCHDLPADYLRDTQNIHGQLVCNSTYRIYHDSNETDDSCLGTYCVGFGLTSDKTCAPTDSSFGNFDCLNPKEACEALNNYFVPSPRSQANCDLAQDNSVYNTSGRPKNKCIFVRNKCEYKGVIDGCEQLQSFSGLSVAEWVSCSECINNPNKKDYTTLHKPQDCAPDRNNHLGSNGGKCKEPGDYSGLLEIDGVCCKFTENVGDGFISYSQGEYTCFEPNNDAPYKFL